MHIRTAAMLPLLALGLPSVAAAGTGHSSAAPGPGGETGEYVLAATSTGGRYAPTFTGNGYIGVRVPPAGQGYAGGTVPTDSTLAGFYAQAPGHVQQRANLPAWSGLEFADGGQHFSLTTGRISGWRQRLDLHTGVITTTATWTAPDGHVTGLRYDVYTDRARPHAAVVRLELTPRWSGTATVTDLIDGTPATLTTGIARGWDTAARRDWETIRTEGTGIIAGLASQIRLGPGAVQATGTPVTGSGPQSVGQQFTFGVTAGRSYTVTKYVGIETAGSARAAAAAARQQASGAAAAGFAGTLAENTAAWRALWAGRIDVLGDPALATDVNASEFYLWSSTRDGSTWSIPPAGLSSNDYNGHIFWDAETWMYPSLLAQHPSVAAGIDAYRYLRLAAAEAHARDTGYSGARFPWESALDGTEQIPPPVSVNSEGVYEQHITADVALAQWQYYLATGDRAWLARYGWPVLSRTAAFWASRVSPGAGGSYHINAVTGPDEENPDVNDEVYTNVAAAATLRMAVQAARVVGARPPASWARIANGLVVLYDPRSGVNPEFSGYQGEMVKQADATMLYYPWGYASSPSSPQADLNYYVPRTDPGGPSMSDAINSADTSALGSPGCASYVYTERSVEPFIRDPFDQFSETRTGGAFTFTTGIGGFLQEFLYGYSGLRWSAASVQLSPSLTGQLGGIVLRDLAWHGSRFTVAIGRTVTTVSDESGPALPVTAGGITRTVPPGGTLTVPTRRPDLTPTTDLARCQPAAASSAQPGADPLAAVDGSPATGWQPQQITSSLDVRLARDVSVSRATLLWGQEWPPPPAANVHPPAGPVKTLRASSYDLVVSVTGRDWTVVASVTGRTTGTRDVLTFPPVRARYVGVRITAATYGTPPILEELAVP
ncbi:MAG: discoidin domain-containing protein [Streptosporangiaceae bacterium]|nr:discoidin domain-containing protein [Streptosporangiaceae bacterium]MBV9854252.1 discoidin domain-containing protein [Streptosporangiaceae bacterium]